MNSRDHRHIKRIERDIRTIKKDMDKLIYGSEYYSHIICKMMDFDQNLEKDLNIQNEMIKKIGEILVAINKKLLELEKRMDNA